MKGEVYTDGQRVFYVDPQPEDSGELPHSVTKMSDQEEPINEDLLDEIHNRWEDDPHTKWPKCPYKDFKNIAFHFANWQKERDAKYRADNNICCMNFDDIEAARIGDYEQEKSDMKQLMMKSSKLSGWVARDENGSLHLFEVEPRRIEDRHQWWDRDYNCTALKKSEFPDLKWEDEPVYVKLPIIVED